MALKLTQRPQNPFDGLYVWKWNNQMLNSEYKMNIIMN